MDSCSRPANSVPRFMCNASLPFDPSWMTCPITRACRRVSAARTRRLAGSVASPVSSKFLTKTGASAFRGVSAGVMMKSNCLVTERASASSALRRQSRPAARGETFPGQRRPCALFQPRLGLKLVEVHAAWETKLYKIAERFIHPHLSFLNLCFAPWQRFGDA